VGGFAAVPCVGHIRPSRKRSYMRRLRRWVGVHAFGVSETRVAINIVPLGARRANQAAPTTARVRSLTRGCPFRSPASSPGGVVAAVGDVGDVVDAFGAGSSE
jgi:hypothetical protein